MDTQKRANVQSLQEFVQQNNQQNTNSDQKVQKHLSSLPFDDPERILDQFLIDWQPTKRFPKLAIINFILCLAFGVFGGVELAYSIMIQENSIAYKSICSNQGQGLGQECIIKNFIIPSTMKGPVYVYYQMNNFFQASSEFSKSKSVDQLKGKDISVAQAQSECGNNYYTNIQMGQTLSITKKTLNPNDVAIPCGLYAYTYFNDTFKIDGVTIDDSNIAWQIDIDNNYVMNPQLQDRAWINLTDQHFMVWMRPSPASTFRKYYGKIHEGLNAGTYTLKIMNNYNSEQYKSTINFVVTTLNQFGQQNYLGSIVLICLSCIFLIAGIICVFKYIHAKKNL
ncbi:hypothetical protein ABPG74_004401 [Tetrahymena malaccensis]